MKDTRGNELVVDDVVRIVSYGLGATSAECGSVGIVVGFGRSRAKIELLDTGKAIAVNGGSLLKLESVTMNV